MSLRVDEVVPPALLLTDDFEPKNILSGLNTLTHCMDNVTRAELLKNNWALVIYDALRRLIHQKDTDVIDKLGPALLKSLTFVEVDPNENCDKFTKYDDTFKLILFTMDCSSQLPQKKSWLLHLISFMDKMGHASLHWIDKINSMLLHYTTQSVDPVLYLRVLMCVETCIKNTWVKPSSTDWIEIILKIIFNTSVLLEDDTKMDPNLQDEIRERIRSCFELLSRCEDYEKSRIQLQEILDLKGNPDPDSGDLLDSKFLKELGRYNFPNDFSNKQNVSKDGVSN